MGSKIQILKRLSEPPVTKRRTEEGEGVDETSEPGMVDGAQETELTPRPWAWKILCSIESFLNL